MADIQSAVVYIGRLLFEEARDLYKAYDKFHDKIFDKVKDLRDEVDLMQCFVRGTDASQLENNLARRWISQMREFAYEAEDIVENLLVWMDRHNTGPRDLWNHAKKYFYVVSEIRAYQRIGSNVDNLKDKISALTSRLHTYGIIKLEMGEISSSWYSKLRDKTYCSYEEEKIVGRAEIVRDLVDEMVDGKRKVLAICGGGGIGKTFLAQKIYKHTDIRRKFEAFAWAYVSQPCQISFIEQQILTKLASKTSEQVAQMTDDELKDELHKAMCKSKCLVVLDGVWEKEVWDSLVEAFPVSNQDFKSKILITARFEEVIKHVDHGAYIRELKPLTKNQSRELLKTKVGPLDISGRNKTAGIIDEMLDYCEGLPLVIVVLGGVLSTLSTKKTTEKLEIVHKNIKSRLLDDQDDGPPWKRILEMCYYELPYQLQAAFNYLGHFPNNLEIPKKKITQMWEVEGLVSPREDPIQADNIQDVAESCLAELVERSLVQVGSRGLSGKPKTCLLNDLIREICISKAYSSNWLKIVNFEKPDPSPSSKNLSKMMKKGYRRLAIYCNESLEKFLHDYRHATYTRSLLFFDTKNMDVLIPLKKLFHNFRLIRVLDIENIMVKNLPDEVGFLIYLRYLSLKDSSVSKVPSTIKYLRCLQTLDLRVLAFVQLQIPDVLWEMGRLVHLYLPTKPFALRHKAHKIQLKGLRNLETLVNFRNSCQEKDVCELTNLRKFSSKDFLCPKKIIDLFSPLHHLDRLSLRLDGQILMLHPELVR